MKHRIALTAWGRIDTLEAFDEKRITAFIDACRGLDHHPRGRRQGFPGELMRPRGIFQIPPPRAAPAGSTRTVTMSVS